MRTPKRTDKDHLTIKLGSLFEATAGGRVAVLLLAAVAIIFIVTQLLERLVS